MSYRILWGPWPFVGLWFATDYSRHCEISQALDCISCGHASRQLPVLAWLELEVAVLHSSSKVLISKRCQFLHPFCGGDSEIVCLVGVARKAFSSFLFCVHLIWGFNLPRMSGSRMSNTKWKVFINLQPSCGLRACRLKLPCSLRGMLQRKLIGLRWKVKQFEAKEGAKAKPKPEVDDDELSWAKYRFQIPCIFIRCQSMLGFRNWSSVSLMNLIDAQLQALGASNKYGSC